MRTTEPALRPEDTRERSEESRHIWWWTVPAAVPLLVFFESLIGRVLLAPNDGLRQFLPWHVLAARIWRSGSIPFWNPYSFSGYPLLSSGQAGVIYPPTALFFVFDPLVANNLFVILHLSVAGLGAWLFARRISGDAVGATAAGLIYSLSGFMFAHLGHQSMLASAAWLPWAFYGYELVRARLTPQHLAIACGSLALSALSGHFQFFAITVLALAIYACVLGLTERARARLRSLLVVAVVLAGGIAMAAVQLLPTLAILGSTTRSDPTFEFVTSYSFPATHLILLLFPNLFGAPVAGTALGAAYADPWTLVELAGYAGAAGLVLACAGLARLRRDSRLLALLVVGVLFLLISVADSTPLAHLVYGVPIYGSVRSWARYAVAWSLLVGVLAACGVARLRSGGRERRDAMLRASVAAAAVVLAAALLWFLPIWRESMAGRSPSLWAVLPPAAVGVGTVVAASMLGRRLWPSVMLVALLGADLVGVSGWFHEWRHPIHTPAEVRETLATTETSWGDVPTYDGGLTRFAYVGHGVASTGIDYPNITDAKGVASVNGRDPLVPRDYAEAVGDMGEIGQMLQPKDFWDPYGKVLDLLRVSVMLTDEGRMPQERLLDLIGTRSVPKDAPWLTRFDRVPRLPEAFVVGAVQELPREQILPLVQHRKRTFDPLSLAYIEEPCPECPSGEPAPAGEAERMSRDPGRAEYRVRTDRPAVLVVSEAWFPGWVAKVNGERSTVFRVNTLVQGVALESAGDHRVVLEYRAPWFGTGVSVSMVALLALLGWLALSRRRSRV